MKKNILIGVSGSIAAYKAADLVNNLKKLNYNVDVIMTANATKFISPLTLGSLTGNKVLVDDFDQDGYQIKHINFAKKADLFVIAPASANIIAKVANGIADDILSSTFLAATCPKLIAPAMNTHMFQNVATQRNLETCRQDGINIIDPDQGLLACGDSGTGKLANITTIIDWIDYYSHDKLYHHKKIVINAGATREALDPVRFITNHSTGKMGYALAIAARNLGMDVTLISANVALAKPSNIDVITVSNSDEMAKATITAANNADYVVLAGAISDYKPLTTKQHKIKKADDELVIKLHKTTDILKTIGQNKKTNQVVCGFAMETENLIPNARKKLVSKNCDLIVANNLFNPQAGFGHDTNHVVLITTTKEQTLPVMTKQELAYHIINQVVAIGEEKSC